MATTRFSQRWSLPPRAPSPLGDDTDTTSKASSRRRKTRIYLRKVIYLLLPTLKRSRPSSLEESTEEFSTASAPSILETLLGPAIQMSLPQDKPPITGIKRSRAAFRDSGISDISLSSPSTSNLLTLPAKHLQRITRSLLHLDLLTTHFSTNLSHLFSKKERSIETNRRLPDDFKELLVISITHLRRAIGQTILKKTLYCQRDLGVLRELLGRGEVTRECVERVARLLREGVRVQREMDGVLRGVVARAVGDRRVGRSEGEKISLRRFERFVEGRLEALGRVYGRLEGRIEALEGALREGEEGDGT